MSNQSATSPSTCKSVALKRSRSQPELSPSHKKTKPESKTKTYDIRTPVPGYQKEHYTFDTKQSKLKTLEEFINADTGDRRYWFLVLSRLIPNSVFVHGGRRYTLSIDNNLENAFLDVTEMHSVKEEETTFAFTLFVKHTPKLHTILECYKRTETSVVQYTLDFDSFIFCVIEWAQQTRNIAIEFLLRSYYRTEKPYC